MYIAWLAGQVRDTNELISNFTRINHRITYCNRKKKMKVIYNLIK